MQKYYDVAGVSGLVKVRTTSVILQAWKGDQNHKKFTFSFRPPSPSPFELAFHLGIRCSGGAGVVSKNRCHSKITGGGERHYLVKRAKLSPWSCCLSSVPSNNTATPVLSSIWECCVVRSIQKRMPLVNKSRCQKRLWQKVLRACSLSVRSYLEHSLTVRANLSPARKDVIVKASSFLHLCDFGTSHFESNHAGSLSICCCKF